jgi:hypothetical protein
MVQLPLVSRVVPVDLDRSKKCPLFQDVQILGPSIPSGSSSPGWALYPGHGFCGLAEAMGQVAE